MSCARYQEALENLALDASPDASIQSHLACCAACRHELAWLRTERQLFLQRAAPQVTVAQAPARAAPLGPRFPAWGLAARAAVAAALAALMVTSASRSDAPSRGDEPLMSEDWASNDLQPARACEPDSRRGFVCGP